MADLKNEYQGIYSHGVLEGVDFTVAGSAIDKDTGKPVNWGSSIKLKFSTIEKVSKDVNGIKVSTMDKSSYPVQISCNTEDINSLVSKWNSEIGKTFHLRLYPNKNTTFKLSEAV